MHEIQSGLLWLGHALDIRDPKPLFDAGIEAVVDVAYEEPPARLPRQLIYCRLTMVGATLHRQSAKPCKRLPICLHPRRQL